MADKMVDAKRFNGLMSNYQKALARIAALEAAQSGQGTGGSPSAPEGSQAAHPAGNGPSPSGAARPGQVDVSQEMRTRAQQVAEQRAAALEAEDRALAQRVAEVRTEKARAAALAKFPGIEALADMLVYDGDDEAFLSAAAQLNEAMSGAPAEAPEAPPEIPVTAGNPPLHRPDPNDARAAARERARNTGDWSTYFRTIDAAARGETYFGE
jgi:hypothetical protein